MGKFHVDFHRHTSHSCLTQLKADTSEKDGKRSLVFLIYYMCDEINLVCLKKLLGIRYSYCCNMSSSKDEQAERNTSEMLRCCFKAQLYLLQEKILKVI